MISADQLAKLRQLFAKRGVTITDSEALQIGLWLLARVRPILHPVSLDKIPLFDKIKDETANFREKHRFVTLSEWRKQKPKQT
jgi:hypothetical protein